MTNLRHHFFKHLKVCLFISIRYADPDVHPEKNLSWFGKLGGNVAGDDSNPILDVDSKPYRDLILANAISLFDFRIYLFACQCAILGRQGRVTDVMSKALNFIGTFGTILRESEVSDDLRSRADVHFIPEFLDGFFLGVVGLLCCAECYRTL
jgi:hypothetical protein